MNPRAAHRILVRANLAACVALACLAALGYDHGAGQSPRLPRREELGRRIEKLEAELRTMGAELVQLHPPATKEGAAIISLGHEKAGEDEEQAKGPVNLLDPVLLADPTYARLLAASRRYEITLAYAALLERLDLDEGRRDALIELLVDRGMAKLDIEMSAATHGLNVKSGGVTLRDKATFAVEQEYRSRISEAIGPANLEQMTAFERTLPLRQAVNTLDARLAAEGVPLDRSQTEAFVELLARNTAPGGPMTGRMKHALEAADFLSAGQRAVLQQKIREEEERRQQRARTQATKHGPAPR